MKASSRLRKAAQGQEEAAQKDATNGRNAIATNSHYQYYSNERCLACRWMSDLMTLTERIQKPIALAMADEGRRVRVVGLRAGRTLDRRLTDLGLNLGSELIVIQRQSGGLLIRRGEARIALGGGMAAKIMVLPVDAAEADASDT